MLAGCQGTSKCGFFGSSGFDDVRDEIRRDSAVEACPLVVLTAVFGSKDKLQQPKEVPSELASCFFAFVDRESSAFLLNTAPKQLRLAGADSHRIGAWRLLTLRSHFPYKDRQPRRNSRVPKMLTFRLFERNNFSLWVDGKLQLVVNPLEVLERYLLRPGAVFAAPRNLRRDHADQELFWIRKTLCNANNDSDAHIDCTDVDAQWRTYESERTHDPLWLNRSVCIEGAMLLLRLRAPAAQCLMCAWYNEWHRFSERDQLAFSYVSAAMDVAPVSSREDGAGAQGGLYLLPRNEHWSWKPGEGEPKPWRFVKYVGHSGFTFEQRERAQRKMKERIKKLSMGRAGAVARNQETLRRARERARRIKEKARKEKGSRT